MSHADSNISIWRGDITCLNADAVVNAANKELQGCFIPLHMCIDNAIHSAAGIQVRSDCAQIIALQKGTERRGMQKLLALIIYLPVIYFIPLAPLFMEDCKVITRNCWQILTLHALM
ncbi:MAG: macro domain-containing protein [Chryseolinea sp.]